MNTTTQLTAQAIFDEAFPASRPKRSEEYRTGVLRQLRYRMMEASDARCPYAAGSVQSDAYWAGVTEAWSLLEKHNADRRRKA